MCRYCAPIDEGNYLEDLFTDVYGDHIHGAVMNENDALIDLDTLDLVVWNESFDYPWEQLLRMPIRCCPMCGRILDTDTPEIIAWRKEMEWVKKLIKQNKS